MTERQARYVEHICREAGRTFDPEMSRAEAQEIVSDHDSGWLSRERAREVACPKCQAEPGHPCWTWSKRKGYGLRKANHAERVRLAVAEKRSSQKREAIRE